MLLLIDKDPKRADRLDSTTSDVLKNGLTIINPPTRLPYRRYKRTAEFEQKQMWKPQLDTRNPGGTAVKRWSAYGWNFFEMRGVRTGYGQCVRCGCWISVHRDVSGPEFRGRGNVGPHGRPPKYCTGCRERVQAERAEQARRRMAQLRRDPSTRKRDFEFRGASRVERLGSY